MSEVFSICRIFCLRRRRQSDSSNSKNDPTDEEEAVTCNDENEAATEFVDQISGDEAQQKCGQVCVSDLGSEIESIVSSDLDACTSLTNVAVSKEKLMELVGDTSSIDRWTVPYSINRREVGRKRLKSASLPDQFGRKDSVYSNQSFNAESTASFSGMDVGGLTKKKKKRKKVLNPFKKMGKRGDKKDRGKENSSNKGKVGEFWQDRVGIRDLSDDSNNDFP